MNATLETYLTAPYRLLVMIVILPVAVYVFLKNDGGE
jgi:hypothetical protein